MDWINQMIASFKKGETQYQVSYLRQILMKPKKISVHAYVLILQEINGYLKYFYGPDLDSPLVHSEIISMLVAMILPARSRKMVSINFEPLSKTLMEVIEYSDTKKNKKRSRD